MRQALEHMVHLENLFKDLLRLRPRNSGSGAVAMPKKELQRTVDTKAYVSDSSNSSLFKQPKAPIF